MGIEIGPANVKDMKTSSEVMASYSDVRYVHSHVVTSLKIQQDDSEMSRTLYTIKSLTGRG